MTRHNLIASNQESGFNISSSLQYLLKVAKCFVPYFEFHFLCFQNMIMIGYRRQRRIKVKLGSNHFNLKFILNYNICGLSLLLVFVPAPRNFSPGTPVFSSPQKPAFLNFSSIWRVSPNCKVHLIISSWNYAIYKFTTIFLTHVIKYHCTFHLSGLPSL